MNKNTNNPLEIIENLDFMDNVPYGASDIVVAICGMLHIIKLLNVKNKSIRVPSNVLIAYGELRKELTSIDHGYIGEFWAHECGVFEDSTPYKVHEIKGAELINNLDRLIAEKFKSSITLH